MKATLFTPNYVVYDLESVLSFRARLGQRFSLILENVEGVDVFTNNDPSLAVDPLVVQENAITVQIEAKTKGVTRLQVRNAGDQLVKEWFITVYDDQAESLNVTAQVTDK